MNVNPQLMRLEPQRTQRAQSSRAQSFLCVPSCPLWLTKFAKVIRLEVRA